MVTSKQRRAVELSVKNGGNITRAMVGAGYSVNTANTPQKLTESLGYKELLIEYGLTEGLIARALVADIEQKPQDRVAELRLAAEIIGMKTDKERPQTIIPILVQIIDAKDNRDTQGV